MSEQPRTRQEMYDLIRQTSKDEFVLTEMKRLGFWKEDEDQPSVSQELIQEKGRIRRELQDLLKQKSKIGNPEQLLKEYKQKRLKESREQQEENRKKRAEAKIAKAEAWKKRKDKEVLFLGEDISVSLHKTESDKSKLSKFGLPHFDDPVALAEAIGISLNELRFLAFNRKVSTVSHYKRFYMQKKSGGKRLISAPMPRLKHVQYWVLNNILNKVPIHKAANGFAIERSIVTNASQHVGKEIVVNYDFKDFFPTLNFKRVKGAFTNLGYSHQLATIFAAICTEADLDEIELDGRTYFVAKGSRFLPQGAPTSPALTNIICYKLDARMEGMAKSIGYHYTRYADDMSFSTNHKEANNLTKLFWRVQSITESEGFVLHPDKLRIMRKGRRQEVTGIVVNDQMGIDRKTLKRFRALLHQIDKNGTKGKVWGQGKDLASSIWGYANFVRMVKPEQGEKLVKEVKRLFANYSLISVTSKPSTKKEKPKTNKDLSKKIKAEQSKIEEAKSKNIKTDTDKKKKNKDNKDGQDGDKPSWKMF